MNLCANFFFLLQETNIHIDLRRVIGLLNIPDQDKYNLEQRAMDIFAKWDQLLLTDLDDYCWARSSPELRGYSMVIDHSLVYIPKHHGERHISVYRESPMPHTLIYSIANISRCREHCIRFGAWRSF